MAKKKLEAGFRPFIIGSPKPGPRPERNARELPIRDQSPKDSKADVAKNTVGLAAMRHRSAS